MWAMIFAASWIGIGDILTTMADTNSAKAPRAVLVEFIAAMCKWEIESWEHMRRMRNAPEPFSYRPDVLQRMNEIFAAFCTIKDRPHGRHGSFQHPPEYDPATGQILEVVEESPRRVVIQTQQGSGFRNRCQHVLLQKGGEWRIESKRIVYDDGTSIPSAL